VDRAALPDRLAAEPPTSMETADEIRASVAEALSHGDGPVLVVSDQGLDRTDPRLIQIAPAEAIDDVGIAAMSLRVSPRPELMVKVLNQSGKQEVMLRVETANKTIERPIRLPARGEARNEFIDLPQAGPVVSVKIEGSDDLEADDQAWLVRGESWPV